MSNKQNDIYFEEVARAEEDLRDATESYENAKEEVRKAYEWEQKMKLDVVEFQNILEKLKNKEA